MLIARIEGATRELGKPDNWPEGQECLTLPIKDVELEDGTPVMASAWQPDAQEIQRIVQGGHVILWVWGRGHPPVAITVAEAPGDLVSMRLLLERLLEADKALDEAKERLSEAEGYGWGKRDLGHSNPAVRQYREAMAIRKTVMADVEDALKSQVLL